ncbi:hypothetical protein LguiA_000815 [Lonicera macranthoides]
MAAESNQKFLYEQIMDSALNRHAISFQSNAIDSTSEMIPMGNYYGVSSTAPMAFSGNSSIINSNRGAARAANSSVSPLLDSIPGLNQDTGLSAEWSAEEQYKLEEGLAKYADEPSMMRYIKIAATLNDKTVRDVTMRCRWMTRKRRKQEDHNPGKKLRKDKLLKSSSKTNTFSSSPMNMAAYSLITNHRNQSVHMSCEAMKGTKHLLEHNNQVLGQISSNLSMLKLQDNIDLFSLSRNNIIAILNHMRETPGIMSQMPPLPLSINEELANSIMYSTAQTTIFGASSGIHLKQEPWMLMGDC